MIEKCKDFETNVNKRLTMTRDFFCMSLTRVKKKEKKAGKQHLSHEKLKGQQIGETKLGLEKRQRRTICSRRGSSA